MEIHNHTHTEHSGPRKKWTHYFWEFLMLFLAVFCGFLAENLREHKVEQKRAKELARSFYEELKNDSAAVFSKQQNRIKQEKALVWLMNYFKDSSLVTVSKTFEINFLYGILFRTPSLFEPKTVVLEQLKNSGSLRYFKNEELQKLIGDLSVAIHNINDRQDLESTVRMQFVNPLIILHFDYDFETTLKKRNQLDIFNATLEYEKNSETISFHFKGLNKFDKEHTINVLGFYGMSGLEATRRIHYQRYIDLNEELLKSLRKEYHLE